MIPTEERDQALRRREIDVKHALAVLLDLETRHGWTSVMAVLRRWLNKPRRGNFAR